MTASYDVVASGSTSPGCSAGGRPRARSGGRGEAAGWQALHLDTHRVTRSKTFYDEVAAAWGLPAWFGRNLDALFDVLGDLTSRPRYSSGTGCASLRTSTRCRPRGARGTAGRRGQAPSFAVIVRDDLGVSEFDGLL